MLNNILQNYLFSIGVVFCGPTLYEVDENLGEANPVMIPVSSTAIPLDDLPVFKVAIHNCYFNETYFIVYFNCCKYLY